MSASEVEIKFYVHDIEQLTHSLKNAGFTLQTPRTHEMNTLYDTPSQTLRRRGELIRIRKYGDTWTVTHKGKGSTSGRHKSRIETETTVADGAKLAIILEAAGLQASFRYEKYRSEWTDGKGHVVIDETPIGNFGEIEGRARWIDRTARQLKIRSEDYITDTYAGLFLQWKKRTQSAAQEMTFAAIPHQRRAS